MSDKRICVITGGGSGMGLATAELMGKDHYVIICGRTVGKLEDAIAGLRKKGVDCEAYPCDVSDKESVKALARHADELGTIDAVIHAAGVSPHMGNGELILKINAIGTMYVNEIFSDYMGEGSCIVDVSSMAGNMMPDLAPMHLFYRLALKDKDAFVKAAVKMISAMPAKLQPGTAYSISKNFDNWYANHSALELGNKGIRVVSVSPGDFETPMGELEKADAQNFIPNAAIKRFGKPEEIATLLADIVKPECGYLTGTQILCDGGVIASMKMDPIYNLKVTLKSSIGVLKS